MTLLNSLKSSVLLLVMAIVFTSCGGSGSMIDNINVSTNDIDGDVNVSLSADLAIGNLQLPNVALPIILPKGNRQIGTLALATSPEGVNQLTVNLNVSETAGLDLESVALPNGNLLPLIGDRQVIRVPVGGGVEVYISLTSDSAAIGVAVPLKAFDVVGRKVGTASLMPIFNSNGISGAAGVFTSKTSGENGFALVADLSGVLGSIIKSNTLEDHSFRMAQKQQAMDLDYSEHKPSRKVERRIKKALYKLHKKKTALEI